MKEENCEQSHFLVVLTLFELKNIQNAKVGLEKSHLTVFWCPNHLKAAKKETNFTILSRVTPTALWVGLKSQGVAIFCSLHSAHNTVLLYNQ